MLTALFRGARRRAARQSPATPRRPVVPRLEVLEDRTVPSTLTVTNLADGGAGSLRGQLAAAAAGDTIAFAPDLQGAIALGSTLTLDRNITVAGNLDAAGNPLVTLSRGGADGSTDLLVGAGVTASVGGLGFTGSTWHALENQGSLTLDHVTVSGNRLGYIFSGLGINYFGTVDNAGTLTVRDSTISDNRVNGRGPGAGDGLQGGAGIWSTGTLTVLRTRLVNNLAEGTASSVGFTRGGAICNWGGTATVTACTLTGNQASDGGGLYSMGTLTISGCTVSDNSAVLDGGGLFAGGTAQVTNCAVTGNTAGTNGGGMAFSSTTLTLSGSTLAGNQVGGGGYQGQGGGLYVGYSAGTVTVTNCTLANNSAVGHGAGGGLYVSSRPLSSVLMTVVGSTVAGNSTDGAGGGLWVSATRTSATLTSTLVAGNTAATAGPDVSGPVLATSAYDLIGDGSGASGLTDGVNGNQVGTAASPHDPRLGPLQNNGGPTPTMALLAGSPALNAGDPAQLGVADQRGVARRGGVNVGAYQASASAFVVTAPATVTAGVPFDLTVKAVDPFGQTAVGYTGTVAFAADDPNPAALVPAAYPFTLGDAGVHTFPGGVTLLTAGSRAVTATDTVTGSITGSASVTVNPAAAEHLVFLQQPTDTPAGQTMSAVIVEVVDQYGNVETGDNSDTITLSLGVNPSGGTLSGTLTLTVVNGVAIFGDLSIDLAGGGYTLHATVGGGLPDSDSGPFTIA
jgi:hypothetical protein